MQRLLLEVCVGLALTLALYVVWNRYEAATERADQAEAALRISKENEHVVVKYVDKVVEVVKRVPVARGHLEQLCRDFILPSPGHPDAAPATDAGGGQIADLAADIGACKANAEQLSALQEVLKPQIKE